MSKSNQATMQSEIFIVLMIFAILLFIVVFQTLEETKEEREKLNEIISKYHLTPNEVKDLQHTMELLRKHQQPPLIKVEVNKFSFISGSAKLSEDFKIVLTKKVTKIREYLGKYSCDMVEIYGYTDGEPYPNSGGVNFDEMAHNCLASIYDCNIKSSSNLELGMARAISVRNFLKSKLSYSSIKIFRPYSGGEFIDSNGEISKIYDKFSNPKRRRIEIRVTRTRDVTSLK